ncbi:LysR family transcriptional regulator [Marinomonas primoryensis]|jgi:hypothetical protein|uniref:LysR family transcriptional regulator n=1 Tax=Marinomonas primoryensis TaxID=178399 RepID=UPI0037040F8E
MFQQLPSLNAIKVFESAARLNSFKDAAKELNVTPTAISHQIRALEDTLKLSPNWLANTRNRQNGYVHHRPTLLPRHPKAAANKPSRTPL